MTDDQIKEWKRDVESSERGGASFEVVFTPADALALIAEVERLRGIFVELYTEASESSSDEAWWWEDLIKKGAIQAGIPPEALK